MSKSTTHSAIIITAFIVTSVINYGFSVALSWFFSPAQFGMLGVAQSLLLTLGLTVGSGFAWLIAHEVATSGVTDETLRNFRTALVANCILGFMLMLGLWFAYLSKLLPLGSEYHLVIPLVGLATLLLAFRAVLNGAMRGLYQFGPLSVNLVGEAIAKAAIGLILVKAGFGVAGVMIGFVCGAGAGLLHSLWIIRPSKFWRGKGWFDIKVVPAALPLFLGMLGPALMMNLDLLGLRILAPAGQGNELAGHYQAAVILARTPIFIAQSLILVMFSYAAKKDNLRESHEAPGYIGAALRVWTRLLLPISLVLILAPKAALTLFFPDQYLQVASTLRIAAAGAALLSLATLLIGVIQAGGDRQRPALITGIAVIVQIVVLVMLLPRWGTIGAALSLLAAGLVTLIGLSPAIFAQYDFSFHKLRDLILRRFYRMGLPLSFLGILLFKLPEGERTAAAVKLGLAGIGYCLALLSTYWRRPVDSNFPIRQQIVQFVNVLLGG